MSLVGMSFVLFVFLVNHCSQILQINLPLISKENIPQRQPTASDESNTKI